MKNNDNDFEGLAPVYTVSYAKAKVIHVLVCKTTYKYSTGIR